MRLCLVTMPWPSLDLPSLPLAILSEVVRAARPDDDVRTYYGNVRWAEYALEHTAGEVTPDDYSDVVEEGLFHDLGDWVFTSALYGDATCPPDPYEPHPPTPSAPHVPAPNIPPIPPPFTLA